MIHLTKDVQKVPYILLGAIPRYKRKGDGGQNNNFVFDYAAKLGPGVTLNC